MTGRESEVLPGDAHHRMVVLAHPATRSGAFAHHQIRDVARLFVEAGQYVCLDAELVAESPNRDLGVREPDLLRQDDLGESGVGSTSTVSFCGCTTTAVIVVLVSGTRAG